jgi:hypothetical protein
MGECDEDTFREFFEELAVNLCGPQDPVELAGDWERFRQERLPGIVAEARALPEDDDDQPRAKHVVREMERWIYCERVREALRTSGRHASAFRVGPDGKLREVWFDKKGGKP